MQCDEVQEYLAERLTGSLSDRLSGTVQSYVRAHMLSCADCCDELEDFEEMQSVLRSIPVQPCDSKAMRARFDLLEGVKRNNLLPVPAAVGTRTSPVKTILVALAAIAVLGMSVAGVRQALKWRAAAIASSAAVARTGTLSGQIRMADGESYQNIRVVVLPISESGLPPMEFAVESNPDGRYRLENIPAGRYYVRADSVNSPTYFPGTSDVRDATAVTVQAGAIMEGIDFILRNSSDSNPAPVAVVPASVKISGELLDDEGSPITAPLSLGEVVLSSSGSSSSLDSSTVRLDSSGKFSRLVRPGEYRLRMASLSQDYGLRSLTAGSTDLLKNNLKVVPGSPVSIEIHVVRRNGTNTGRILGSVMDVETDTPGNADQVVLCCFAAGTERIFAPVASDGTFEFHGVPAGRYTAELRGRQKLVLINPAVQILPGGISGLKLLAAEKVVTVDVDVRSNTGERLPFTPGMRIELSGVHGTFRTSAVPYVGNLFRIPVPANNTYNLAISNYAPGYTVESIVDSEMTDLMRGGHFTVTSANATPARIVVTLSKN